MVVWYTVPMTTHDEALSETREALKAAGVPLDENGRVVPVSGLLEKIAEDGGGVLDAETAMEMSVRVHAGEQALLSLSRSLIEVTKLIKQTPALGPVVFNLFSSTAIKTLADAIPKFVYGVSPGQMLELGRPMTETDEFKAEYADVLGKKPESAEDGAEDDS